MAIDMLLKEVQGLPESAVLEVLRFIRFIKTELPEGVLINKSENVEEGGNKSLKKEFLKSAGKIQIDAQAVSELRERSMI